MWLDEALASEAAAGQDASSPQLQGDVTADVCIVGGGYTGLWAALRLKELAPSLDVVVVERDLCGAGASGRNAGFVLSWWAKFHSLQKLAGIQEALRLAEAALRAMGNVARSAR